MENIPRIHYFDEGTADPKDVFLNMSIDSGYVPKGCLLIGQLVWGLISDGKDPCKGCRGDRDICKGRSFE